MKFYTGATVAALFVLLTTQAVWAQTPSAPPATVTVPQTVALRYKFTPGEVIRYKMIMDMDGTILTGTSGAGFPMKQHMETVARMTVKSVRPSDGAATIETQVESLTGTVNGQEMPITDQMKAQMQKIGTVVMLPTGKVLVTKIAALSSPSVPGMNFGQSNFLQSGATLPDGPVKVGDFWKAVAASGPVGAQIQLLETLTGIDTTGSQTMADIALKTNGAFNALLTKNMPFAMKMMGKITGTGQMRFDNTAGDMAGSKATNYLKFTLIPRQPAKGAVPNGMPSAIKMTMRQDMTMQRLKDAPATVTPPAGNTAP